MARPTKKKATDTPLKEETPTPKPVARTRARLATGDNKFDIFADTTRAQQTKDLLAKVGLADGFKSASEINRDYLPVPWLAFQYLIGRIGIPTNTIVEFIGQENTGKSSLVVALMCGFIKYNIPCLYANTEPKMLESDWMSRLAGTDPEVGEKIKSVLEVTERLYTLDEMDMLIRQWVKLKRTEQGIPVSVPLVVVVDTITKLLNPEEAKALMDEGTGKGKKSHLDNTLSGISQKPGVTAKWLHEWCRSIKVILERENVTLICVSGQNINMNSSPTAFSADGGASLNKTRPGGTALNQSAAIQMTITRKGLWKASDTSVIGERIRARVVKNSYGPKRDIEYGLRNDAFKDSAGYTQQAIDMVTTFCDALAANKVLGVTCTAKRYSSEKLGLVKVEANTLYTHITSDPDLARHVCTALRIGGYEAINT